MKNKALFFAAFFSLLVFLFYPTFSIKFNSDDYFVLQMVMTKNIPDFIKLFLPIKEVVYYRPLGIQLYFWLAKAIFSQNPFFYHLLGFIIHILNSFLVFLIIKKISGDKLSALLAAFLYGTSAIHFLSLAWIVNFSYLLVTFFYFLAFYLWLESKIKLFLIIFILGLLTNELMITLPIVLFFYSILFNKKKLFVIYAALLVLFYLVLRFLVFKTATGGDYAFTFSPKVIINNFQWYILWSFGWPETMRDQMINFFTRNPRSDFLVNFKTEFTIFLAGVYTMILLLLIFKIKKIFNKKILFSLILFCVSLMPVIFFKTHSYPHYAGISLLGIVLFISLRLKKITIIAFLVIWVFVSKTAIDLNMKVHWVVWHSQLAQKLIVDAKKDCKFGSKEITVKGNITRNKLVLANQSAMRVVFNSDTIKTIFVR